RGRGERPGSGLGCPPVQDDDTPRRGHGPPEDDVLGIGNALVDGISQEDDGLVASLAVPQGRMTLAHEDVASEVVRRDGPGNALVDVISQEDDGFVASLGVPKGSMTLVDEDVATEVYDRMGPAIEISGGSAANTIVGVAALGGTAQYIGKVRDDQLGEVFAHDIRATGVLYETPLATAGPPTGRCLVMVTPDAQRTMQTYLGASVHLGPGDVDPEAVRRAGVLYLEGY